MRTRSYAILFLTLLALFGGQAAMAAGGGGQEAQAGDFPKPLSSYQDEEEEIEAETGKELSLGDTLVRRIKDDPFNLVATIIFLMAVGHTFLCGKFNKMAHHYEHDHQEKLKAEGRNYPEGKEPVSFKATLFHFLGEVEAIFGLWVIPLIIAITVMHGWGDAVDYIDHRNYVEPIFVVVIMAIASTRPVVKFAESCLKIVASWGGGTTTAWWFSILTVAPLLGSFITEPAAMTIAAMLLGQQFYKLDPSNKLKYATLGLLFVNISVGGTLTHFAAPPVLMVATPWDWDMPFMFTHFGWRAMIGIVVANILYFSVFRKELKSLRSTDQTDVSANNEEPVPMWIILVHLGFLAWTVYRLHHPVFFVGGFLFFLGFTKATEHHQYDLNIKSPMLVGFFLAGLVIHGGLQGWWIAPVLSSMGENALFAMSTILTAFNDNAAITFLASQVPAFSPLEVHHGVETAKEGAALAKAQALQYAVVAGAVTGGGLTVIANAPNPAGQSILNKYFKGGISPIGLLLGALIPTLIMAVCFIVIPH